jgi:hypothetical protein
MPARPGRVAAALLGVALAGAPWVLPSAGRTPWDFPAAEYRRVEAEREDLDALCEYRHRQTAASEQVVGRLAGGLSLAAAVAELEQINRDRAPFAVGLAARYPDAPSHRLRLARWAAGHAARGLNEDPTRCAELEARLEAEYRAMAAAD